MKKLPFKSSPTASIGIELEFQIVDAQSFALASKGKELFRNVNEVAYKERIKPEITQAMIEINSSIHYSPQEMLNELWELQAILVSKTADFNIRFCGGGTHAFQNWVHQKIFPMRRYKHLYNKYRYLCKRGTVFGQHVHVGCANGDEAIYLTHAFSRYVPQFIAISASSPFYQGIDTGFASNRTIMFHAFPSSGVMPPFRDWEEFSIYFYKMKAWGIVDSMKDLYWDIRPKYNFGAVEIRTMDTPLNIKKAVAITAYIQALALYLLREKPAMPIEDLFYLYNYNRFQACRYGLEGKFTDPSGGKVILIYEDVLNTLDKIEKYAKELGSEEYLEQIRMDMVSQRNDAILLRDKLKKLKTFSRVIAEQCDNWLTSV